MGETLAPADVLEPKRALSIVANGDSTFPALPHHTTIRQLVGIADAIPQHRVVEAICYYADRLADVPLGSDRQRARYVIMIGALSNRDAFEVLQLSRDADLPL